MVPRRSETQQWPDDGRRRVAVDALAPDIDGGRFPVKRERGERGFAYFM